MHQWINWWVKRINNLPVVIEETLDLTPGPNDFRGKKLFLSTTLHCVCHLPSFRKSNIIFSPKVSCFNFPCLYVHFCQHRQTTHFTQRHRNLVCGKDDTSNPSKWRRNFYKRCRETGWPFGKKKKKKLTCDYSTPCEDKIHMDKNTRRKHGKKFE